MREANIPPFNDKSKIRTRNHLPSSYVDPQKHCLKKPPNLDAEETAIWRDWVSCMIDSSQKDAWKLHHVPSHKRIQLSFAWKQHPVSTDTIWWWFPTGWRCRKTTQCCFCYDESCSLLLWPSIAHWRICWFSLLMTNSHWLMKMPTGCFADVVETFSLTTTCQFHWHFPPFVSWKERQSSPKYIWTPPFKCRRVSLLYSLVQLHKSTIIGSLLATLCVIVVGCRTEITIWLWMTIPKDRSIHNVSSIWMSFVGCDIFLRNDWACHNGDKDGNQNTDLPYDRFFDNANMLVCL